VATLNFTNTLPINTGFGLYNTNWQSFSFIFQASSSVVTTIAFSYSPQTVIDSENDIFYGSGGLDAVSVTAVPQPSIFTLALLGSGALIYVRHKRKWRSRLKT
jgi:hypothetical protein